MPTLSDNLLVAALVKLRHRIAGEEMRLTQAEAQALYLAVLPPRAANSQNPSAPECAESSQERES